VTVQRAGCNTADPKAERVDLPENGTTSLGFGVPSAEQRPWSSTRTISCPR